MVPVEWNVVVVQFYRTNELIISYGDAPVIHPLSSVAARVDDYKEFKNDAFC